MIRAGTWLSLVAGVALSAVLVSPAAAQRGGFGQPAAPLTPPDPAAARAAELAEQTSLLRLLVQSKISNEALQQIRDVVARAEAQLAAGDASVARELAAGQAILAEAKKALLSGQGLNAPTPQENQVATSQAKANGQRSTFVGTTVQQILQLLQSLAPEDRAAAIAAGTALVRDQRAQQGATFGGPGGPGARVANQFDRLRNADPQRYQQERMRFAMQNAGIFGRGGGGPGGGGRGGGGGGAAFGLPGGGGGGGGRGQRGGPGGGGFQPPNMNDPATQARLQPYLNMADQIRNMPQGNYQRTRDQMAAQMEAQRQQERINQPVPDDQALNALARALATPNGLAVMEAKVGKAAQGGNGQ